MDYRRFDDTVLVRMDRGEEILEQLRIVAEAEQIGLASVSAIGAIGSFTAGVFHPDDQRYEANTFTGNFEIVSLTGNITAMDGKYYAHLHISAGDEQGRVFGGHLNRAEVSATCELFLRLLPGTVDRTFSKEIGLNLLDFEKSGK